MGALSDLLQQYLDATHCTRRELARISRVSNAKLDQVLRGDIPKAVTLRKLAGALNADFTILYDAALSDLRERATSNNGQHLDRRALMGAAIAGVSGLIAAQLPGN